MLMRLLLNFPLIFLSATLVSKSPTLEISNLKHNTAAFKVLPSVGLDESVVVEAESCEESSCKKLHLAVFNVKIPAPSVAEQTEFEVINHIYFDIDKAQPSGRGPPSLPLS